jgi:hypothetical protein
MLWIYFYGLKKLDSFFVDFSIKRYISNFRFLLIKVLPIALRADFKLKNHMSKMRQSVSEANIDKNSR